MYSQGGGHGQSALPPGVTQTQLDEVRAFNSGLTQAGKKSRPSRNRGDGAGYVAPRSTGRLQNNGAYGSRVPTSSANAFSSRSTDTNIRTSAPNLGGRPSNLAKPAGPLPHLAHQATGRNELNPVALPPHLAYRAAGPADNGNTPTSTVQQSSDTHFLAGSSMGGAAESSAQHQSPGDVRELIITNMSKPDPSKPFIPAHLQQASAYEAIKEMAKMTGKPIENLTADGVSIPAPRGWKITSPQFNPTQASATFESSTTPVPVVPKAPGPNTVPIIPATIPPDAVPEAWFTTVLAKKNIPAVMKGAGFAADVQMQGTYRNASGFSVKDVDMLDADSAMDTSVRIKIPKPVQNLAASVWATSRGNETAKPIVSKEPFTHDMEFYPQDFYSVPKLYKDDYRPVMMPSRIDPGVDTSARTSGSAGDLGNPAPKVMYLMEGTQKDDRDNAQFKGNGAVKGLKDSLWA